MGKDNIEFHTLMWPGILIGSDLGFILPQTIYAYEYLLSKGIKFSKSRGIGLNLESALEIAEPDYWRFALAMLLPEGADTDFSVERFTEIIEEDMNNKIGNFAHRVVTLASGKRIRAPQTLGRDSADVNKRVEELISRYEAHFEAISIREALHDVLEIASIGNEYISNAAPWKLKEEKDADRASEIIYTGLGLVYKIAMLLYPFIPNSSIEMLEMLGYKGEPSIEKARHGIIGEIEIKSGIKPIFSKLTEQQIEKLNSFK
jgi:methionyl-tRNA synthetase